MKLLHALRVLLFMPCLFLIFPFLVPAEEVKRSTSLSIEGVYYFDDNKGYGVSDGGFAPSAVDPQD
jgi:hypothetical protein